MLKIKEWSFKGFLSEGAQGIEFLLFGGNSVIPFSDCSLLVETYHPNQHSWLSWFKIHDLFDLLF